MTGVDGLPPRRPVSSVPGDLAGPAIGRDRGSRDRRKQVVPSRRIKHTISGLVDHRENRTHNQASRSGMRRQGTACCNKGRSDAKRYGMKQQSKA